MVPVKPPMPLQTIQPALPRMQFPYMAGTHRGRGPRVPLISFFDAVSEFFFLEPPCGYERKGMLVEACEFSNRATCILKEIGHHSSAVMYQSLCETAWC